MYMYMYTYMYTVPIVDMLHITSCFTNYCVMSIDDTPSPEEEGQWGDMGLQARGGVQQWYGWV